MQRHCFYCSRLSNFPFSGRKQCAELIGLKRCFFSNVSDKDTGVKTQHIYCCAYFDLKRRLYKMWECTCASFAAPSHGLKHHIRVLILLSEDQPFSFFLHWGLWTFLLLLLTLQTKGRQSSRLGWLKYSPCKSIAQTEVPHTRLCCARISASHNQTE